MLIGIDASRAFLRRRTGIEEYSYQVIRSLRDAVPKENRVVLYVRPGQRIDFEIPRNWMVKKLWAPRFWTQVRLSLEMLFHPPDVLFVPAHTVPIIHPKDTVVTVHGLEYETFPEAYSFLERLYMGFSIRFSVRVASRVIAVSENTKRDLARLYGVPEGKMSVVYEGVGRNQESGIRNRKLTQNSKFKIQNTYYSSGGWRSGRISSGLSRHSEYSRKNMTSRMSWCLPGSRASVMKRFDPPFAIRHSPFVNWGM